MQKRIWKLTVILVSFTFWYCLQMFGYIFVYYYYFFLFYIIYIFIYVYIYIYVYFYLIHAAHLFYNLVFVRKM